MPFVGLADPHVLKALAIFATAFLVMDLIFLGIVAKSFYRRQLGTLLRTKFDGAAALAFYLAYVVAMGLLVFVPAREYAWPLSRAVATASIFGFAAYATYNFTNMATLRDWPRRLSLVDMLWGTTLTASATAIALRLA